MQEACGELDEYHPCLCHELMGGGLNIARAMGWLRGPSESWSFHAIAQNAATCALVGGSAADGSPAERLGFCCHD